MITILTGMVLAAIAAPAQTFKTLVSFNGTNGADPLAPVVQGTNGNFYGTTEMGGLPSQGTVFEVTSRGALKTLFTFDANDTAGGNPFAALILATDGNFYGAAEYGGPYGCGTVFKITALGALTVVHNLVSSTDGCGPTGALIQATDGNFYGTTTAGGGTSNAGTLFKITPSGTLTTLHSFDVTDGIEPFAGLIQGNDGNLYGITAGGGASTSCSNGCGTIFKIVSGGALTTLHSFDSTDGAYPYGGLVQASDGSFYGTTEYGGTENYGTIFKITSGGVLTTLHSFDSADGAYPFAALIQATDGNLYSSTTEGGSSSACTFGCGTIFKITPGGMLTTLHNFDSTDGATPNALLQATDGNFYGTTVGGGASLAGTIFSLSVGLGPFVKTVPAAGRDGKRVTILGTNLTGTTKVTFNGTPVPFSVISSTEISTAVPTGATTGPVQVVTPSGTLTSSVNFQVLP